jgi:ADP-ribose pyrophosphatase YjhB (NUDIX family)
MDQTRLQEPTHVVTSFLLRNDAGRDEVLLVRRSQRVRTYRGAWASISGYVEPGVTSLDQAYTELREETGLERGDVKLLRTGMPIAFYDAQIGQAWVVHPFLFAVEVPDHIRTDWEATEHRWVTPPDVSSYETVPKLAEALASVYPPQDSAHGSA